MRSLAPNGENPLEKTTVWKDWASPADCDWNMHLSNSSYPKTLDSARMKGALEFCGPFLKQGGNIALGGTHFNFIQEIPLNSRYEIRIRLACWDEKWMYLVAQYVIPPKASRAVPTNQTKALVSDLSDALNAKKGEGNGVDILPNPTGTPSTPLQSSTPPTGPKKTPTILEDGSILACTAVSILCCKYGRSTVPTPLALAVSGMLLSEEEWRAVKRLTGESVTIGGKPGPNAIKPILKGGWRDVLVKHEAAQSSMDYEAEQFEVGKGAWWLDVVKRQGAQDLSDERLKSLGKLRQSMEDAKEMSKEWK